MGRPRKQAEITTAADIYLGADGRYHGWVEFPYLPGSSPDRPLRVHRSGKDSDLVKAKVALLERHKAAGLTPEGKDPEAVSGVPLGAWLTRWLTLLSHAEPPLVRDTLAAYRSDCTGWIIPALGHIDVAELTANDLSRLYQRMRESPGRNGKLIAGATILRVHAVIKVALRAAIDAGLIPSRVNVARVISPPAKKAPPKKFDTAEAKPFLAALEGHPRSLRWRLALVTASRQSTTLGLRWQCVDFQHRAVNLAWQLGRSPYEHGCADSRQCVQGLNRCRTGPCSGWTHGCSVTSTPPACGNIDQNCPSRVRPGACTHRAPCPPPCAPDCAKHPRHCPSVVGGEIEFRRPKGWDPDDLARTHWVELPESMMVELADLHTEQASARSLLGDLYEDHDLVFCRPDGRPLSKVSDRAELRGLLAKAGLQGYGTHWLRHLAATHLYEESEEKAATDLLDHSDPTITRRTYAGGAKRPTRRGSLVVAQGLLASPDGSHQGLATGGATSPDTASGQSTVA